MNAVISGEVICRGHHGFTRTAAPADATLRWMLSAVDRLAQATNYLPTTRLLVDLTAVSTTPSEVEQAILGEHVARQFTHLEKVASLVASGTRTGISERVAQSLGLNLRVFTREADAVEWLER